ncbi:MAG: sigma-54 dependent transcriptional regulator [bacterium]
MPVAKILVVDDESDIVHAVNLRLENLGYEVDTASSGFTALEKIALNKYDVVLLDLAMPIIDGVETFKRIKNIDEKLPVIFMTAYGDSKLAEAAKKWEPSGYITKPFDKEKLKDCVERALLSRGFSSAPLRKHIQKKYGFREIIGKSSSIRQTFKSIEKVKDNDVTVLIHGESGTGKELVARAIHFNGVRKEGPFISINCSAIPETLLESELFGFEKGSFTDAKMRKLGKFELAHKGSLFLDEIGEMSASLQVKILRVMEEKEFMRIGGKEKINVDVRIIAATNKDLDKEVQNGNFREDLYYRINVFPIYLHPLRERKEDIPLLIQHIVDRLNSYNHHKIKHILPETVQLLTHYSWRGNVRELENVIERAMILSDGDTLKPEYLPACINIRKENISSLYLNLSDADIPSLEEIEKEAISKILSLTKGNISQAAEKLKIGRTTFYRKARKHGIM